MASNEYHYGFCRSCEKPCWRRRAVQEDPVHYAIVETARSGQSCCTRGCGELIAKGSLRIGIPLKDSRGCGGAISAWTHLECTMLTQLRDPALTPKFDVETHVYGLDALDGASRASVVAEFSKEDREADKTLDPEDAAFLPQRALPRVAPPPNIALPLLPYQEEGFGWMLRRERESTGGILADEMGMGKTLQCVSLMAHDACERAKTKTSLPITLAQDEEAYGYSLPDSTLVVAPSSALWQWKDEIEKFWVAATDEKGRPLKAPSVEVYYGNRKRVTPEKLQKADVVLTSYPVLEYEYRREHARCKVKCPCCAKLMLPRKLRQHLKYMCGPYARRTAGQQKTERAAGDRAVASAKKKKKKRGPAKPKPAKTALSFYKAATRDEAKAELPEDAPNKDIAALQTKQWKALDAAARRPYVSLAETDKARHARDVKTYEALLKEFEAQASDADDEAAAATSAEAPAPADGDDTPARSEEAAEPMVRVIDELASRSTLLCLDEMQVTDVADAMVLRQLFEGLLHRGVRVVFTSNRPPEELYERGLNRQYFLPFVRLLHERCAVVRVGEAASPVDYRGVEPPQPIWELLTIRNCALRGTTLRVAVTDFND